MMKKLILQPKTFFNLGILVIGSERYIYSTVLVPNSPESKHISESLENKSILPSYSLSTYNPKKNNNMIIGEMPVRCRYYPIVVRRHYTRRKGQ